MDMEPEAKDPFTAMARGECHVFMSCRDDTSKGFTAHLYAALVRRGIITFYDDYENVEGEYLPVVYGMIQRSQIAIVVLSENYASSPRCLNELQYIVECRKKLGKEVLPIFYGVQPLEVRHQKGNFAEKEQRWRDALTEVANISGWNSEHWNEAELIQNIVQWIWTKVLSSYHNNDLIGIDSRIVEMESLLGMGEDDIRFIGIWGVGGIGKTTLAEVVYKIISSQYEICCFLENIRETSTRFGEVYLQLKLLSHLGVSSMVINKTDEGKNRIKDIFCSKRVLLVLDDVNDITQIENLAESPNWFGIGSRVIITTRDENLLKSCGDKIYKIEAMNKDESLQLFSRIAFHKDHPEEDYLNLSLSVVQYAKGLPLALQILGSYFFAKSIPQWEDALLQLKHRNKTMTQTLMISYDQLEEEDKAIFLDIACFFSGWRKDEITQVLANYGLHPTIESGLGLLTEISFIIEERNCLEMHNLLQELGRNIVLENFPNSVFRLRESWSPKDIDEVLERNMGHEGLHKLKSQGVRGLYEIEIQIEEQSLQTSTVWRIVGFVSSVVGVVSYSLSSSFNLLFGEWRLWKIFVYSTMCFIVCGIMLFPRIGQGLRSPWVKPHLIYMVLMLTTLYSFYYDKHMTKKPDVLSPISSGAFSLMSLSLSKQTELGFELGMSIFWLAFLMLQLMKIKLILGLVAVIICYFFILVHSNWVPEPHIRTARVQDQESLITIIVDPENGERGATAVNQNVHPEAETAGVQEQKIDMGNPENDVEKGVVQ